MQLAMVWTSSDLACIARCRIPRPAKPVLSLSSKLSTRARADGLARRGGAGRIGAQQDRPVAMTPRRDRERVAVGMRNGVGVNDTPTRRGMSLFQRHDDPLAARCLRHPARGTDAPSPASKRPVAIGRAGARQSRQRSCPSPPAQITHRIRSAHACRFSTNRTRQ
jgi:hypothetical protein